MPGESVDDVVALLNVAEDHVSEALRAVRQALLDAAEVTRVVANVGLMDKSRQLSASLSHVAGADDTLEKLGEDLRNAIDGFVAARGHESGETGRLDFGSLYRPRADAFAFSSPSAVPADELTPLDPTHDAGFGVSDPVDFSSVAFNPDDFHADDGTADEADDVEADEIAPVDDEIADAELADEPDEADETASDKVTPAEEKPPESADLDDESPPSS